MKIRQLFYFLISGILLGLLILSLEIRVISKLPLEWEATSAFELFLLGIPWYLALYFIMSFAVAGILLAISNVFPSREVNKKEPPNQLRPFLGLSILLFLYLLFIVGTVFGNRLFLSSFSKQLLIGVILIATVFLLTLAPYFLVGLFKKSRNTVKVGLQLFILSWISFVSITWLHQKSIAVTEKTSLTNHILTLDTLIWLFEGLLLSGLALILLFVVNWLLKRLKLLNLASNPFDSTRTPILFFIVLTILVWIWILIPTKSREGLQAGVPSDVTPPSNSPNVIQIVVDTLGGKYVESNDLGLYPGFAQLAEDGFRFDRAYATASSTAWSIPTILTSNFSFVNSKKQFDDFGWLSDSEVTTAEILKNIGYQTVGFSTNPVVSKTLNYHQGFDYFADGGSVRLFVFNIHKALGVIKPRFAYKYGLVDAGFYYQDVRDLYSKIEKYLLRKHSRPFYLYVQTMDMHGPYMPPKEYLDHNFKFGEFISYSDMLKQKDNGSIKQVPKDVRENALQLYLGELKYTDEYIGMLIQLLRKLNLYDNTLIIVTSDHGEEFWEHGSVIHGHTLYDELIRVPLFIKPPTSSDQSRHFSRGLTIKTEVSTLDILPTIVDFMGTTYGSFENEKILKGRSLVPLMLGKENETENRTLFGVTRKLYYVMQDGWKIIGSNSRNPNKLELYNLRDDIFEKRNLFSSQHPMVQKLLPKLEEFAQNFNTERDPVSSPELPTRMKEELKTLGYIQ